MAKPVFGTAEWAKYNLNCQSGCSHGCLYCYAQAQAQRFNMTDLFVTERVVQPSGYQSVDVMVAGMIKDGCATLSRTGPDDSS